MNSLSCHPSWFLFLLMFSLPHLQHSDPFPRQHFFFSVAAGIGLWTFVFFSAIAGIELCRLSSSPLLLELRCEVLSSSPLVLELNYADYLSPPLPLVLNSQVFFFFSTSVGTEIHRQSSSPLLLLEWNCADSSLLLCSLLEVNCVIHGCIWIPSLSSKCLFSKPVHYTWKRMHVV